MKSNFFRCLYCWLAALAPGALLEIILRREKENIVYFIFQKGHRHEVSVQELKLCSTQSFPKFYRSFLRETHHTHTHNGSSMGIKVILLGPLETCEEQV